MKFFHKNSSTILVILLFVAAMVAYNYLWKPTQTSVSEEAAAAVGSDLIDLSNTLQGVSLDTDLFTKPSYSALQDFSRPLTPQPLGRENPFQ